MRVFHFERAKRIFAKYIMTIFAVYSIINKNEKVNEES